MEPNQIIWKDSLCCEPIIRKTAFGLLLLVECGGGKEPDPDNKMLSFVQKENGIWQGPFAVWPEEPGAQCMTEMVVTDNCIYGFFCRHDGDCLNFRSVIRKSKDGIHWQDTNEFQFDGRNLLFRGAAPCENGDIMISYQRYILTKEDEMRMKAEGKALYQGYVQQAENGSVILRNGQLVCRSEKPAITSFPTEHGCRFVWTEAAALWLGEQKWLQLVRMDRSGVLYRIDTKDNGLHWSQPVPTDIPNPGSKIRLFTLPDGDTCLVHTPNSHIRNPLEIWYSRDNLNTFFKKIRLSEDDRLYHYADTCIADNILYLVIERDRKEVLLYTLGV